MYLNDKLDRLNSQRYYVVKSNDLIQKSRYQLSLSEQRAIAYICSLIKPLSDAEKEAKTPFVLDYEFNILDYAKTCEIEDNGRVYEETKNLLKGLVQKVYWITLSDGTETTVNWVNKVWVNKRSGIARIRLDEDMIPYLFGLQEKFTSYGLYNILRMRSQYSIRLYELFCSYEYQHIKIFDLIELKKMLMVDNVKSYDNYKDFRVKVLEIAISEINEYTDINVLVEPIKKGNKVVSIQFSIRKNRFI